MASSEDVTSSSQERPKSMRSILDPEGSAHKLAVSFRIAPGHTLPQDVDLTDEEFEKTFIQVFGLSMAPKILSSDFGNTRNTGAIFDNGWFTFTANHLPQLWTTLRSLSTRTQKKAITILLLALSSIRPKAQHYLRKFLQSAQSKGIAEYVALLYLNSSGPIKIFLTKKAGSFADTLVNFLIWCPPEHGDDGKAAMNAITRARLLACMTRLPSVLAMDFRDEVEGVTRLIRHLRNLEDASGSSFVSKEREILEGRLNVCANEGCGAVPKHVCSKCKTVRYCGATCQRAHWKGLGDLDFSAHSYRCFKTEY